MTAGMHVRSYNRLLVAAAVAALLFAYQTGGARAADAAASTGKVTWHDAVELVKQAVTLTNELFTAFEHWLDQTFGINLKTVLHAVAALFIALLKLLIQLLQWLINLVQ
mgnify:CR=1 FL=1